MKETTMMTRSAVMLLAVIAGGTAMAQPAPKVTVLMTKDIPNDPKHELEMLLVEHAPGGASPVHRHNAQAMVYVLEGSAIMQVKGGQEVTLTPGQTFYEGPEDLHTVDRNASKTEPAKFVVFLVKEKGVPALIPVE
jgi:quercetin dioxygenase-like cupin family protein